MLMKRRTFLSGLSSLALMGPANAGRHGKTLQPGDLIFYGPQTPWVGPSVDFATHGRLRVNSSGRFLEHVDGTYFPYVADTGWELTSNTSLAEATVYLEDRRAKGFTVVSICLIGIFYSTNRNSVSPFIDFNTPNEAFFSFVDSVVAVAKTKGIALLFFLIWANDYGLPSHITIDDFTQTQAANFGTYVANRYGSEPHILFGVGGDYNTPINSTVKDKYVAMGAAINGQVPGALITAHSGGPGNSGSSSSLDFQSYSWYSFSGCQSSLQPEQSRCLWVYYYRLERLADEANHQPGIVLREQPDQLQCRERLFHTVRRAAADVVVGMRWGIRHDLRQQFSFSIPAAESGISGADGRPAVSGLVQHAGPASAARGRTGETVSQSSYGAAGLEDAGPNAGDERPVRRAEDHLLPRVELRVELHAVWRQFDRQHGKNLGVEREGVLVRREDGGDHLHRHLFE